MLTKRIKLLLKLKKLNFDNFANEYDQKRNKMYLMNIKKLLKKEVKENSRVLDIGCGTGTLLNYTNPEYGIGIDKSKEMVKLAKNNYPKHKFYYKNIEKSRVKEKFEYILMIDMIFYLNDMVKTFKKIRGSCDKTTKVIIISPNPNLSFYYRSRKKTESCNQG